jgi:hypothetical protein
LMSRASQLSCLAACIDWARKSIGFSGRSIFLGGEGKGIIIIISSEESHESVLDLDMGERKLLISSVLTLKLWLSLLSLQFLEGEKHMAEFTASETRFLLCCEGEKMLFLPTGEEKHRLGGLGTPSLVFLVLLALGDPNMLGNLNDFFLAGGAHGIVSSLRVGATGGE